MGIWDWIWEVGHGGAAGRWYGWYDVARGCILGYLGMDYRTQEPRLTSNRACDMMASYLADRKQEYEVDS